MAKSGYVFEKGDKIDVGSHGETSFLFHSGDAVPNNGVSPFVFEAGVGLGGGKLIDDFERGDLSPYSVNSGSGFSIESGTVFEGTYSASASTTGTSDNIIVLSFPGDGLTNYPGRGDSFEQYIYTSPSNDSSNNYGINFFAEDSDNFYTIWCQVGDDKFQLSPGGLGNYIATANVTIPTDEWLRILIEDSNDTITCTLFDSNDTQIAQVSATTTTHTGSGWGAANAEDGGGFCAVDAAKLV